MGYSREVEFDPSPSLSRLKACLEGPRFNSCDEGRAQEPSQLLPHLYLGDCSDACSLGLLAELGVTHVLNCAGAARNTDSSPYVGQTSVRSYLQLDADDSDSYQISEHFDEAIMFIESARESGGITLVHCVKGVNRSVVICLAYLMTSAHMSLWCAVERVRSLRGRILTNSSFQKQLVEYAHKTGKLKS